VKLRDFRFRGVMVVVIAAAVLAVCAPSAGAVTVQCRGGSNSCTARVSLAGGVNEPVVIRLSDTDLRLVSVRPNRPSLRGAYSLTHQRLRAGGSEFAVRLTAMQSIGRGSFLTFMFRAPGGGGTTVARCRGGSNACTARVSLAGGASNRSVVIQLTDSDLRLQSVRPNRASLRGAYSITHQRLREGGTEYALRLSAVQSIPRGSFLRFRFGIRVFR
jgi:hypothetical protein